MSRLISAVALTAAIATILAANPAAALCTPPSPIPATNVCCAPGTPCTYPALSYAEPNSTADVLADGLGGTIHVTGNAGYLRQVFVIESDTFPPGTPVDIRGGGALRGTFGGSGQANRSIIAATFVTRLDAWLGQSMVNFRENSDYLGGTGSPSIAAIWDDAAGTLAGTSLGLVVVKMWGTPGQVVNTSVEPDSQDDPLKNNSGDVPAAVGDVIVIEEYLISSSVVSDQDFTLNSSFFIQGPGGAAVEAFPYFGSTHGKTISSATGTGNITVELADVPGSPNADLSEAHALLPDASSLGALDSMTGQHWSFPDGLVAFTLAGLPPGQTAWVKITFPTPVAAAQAVYFKADASGFTAFDPAVVAGNTVAMPLRDGSYPDDLDGLVNGTIVDPGGIAIPATPTALAPIASAGAEQSVYLGDVASLGGAATDPNLPPLPITSWQWTVASAPSGATWTLDGETTPSATFTPSQAGDYVLSLVAGNQYARSAPSFVTIHVVTWLPPAVVATIDRSSGPAPLTVCFDASQSASPEGSALAFQWSFGDGTTSAASTVCHAYPASTLPYTATVTVTDARGYSGSDLFTITSTQTNRPPMASPTATPPSGPAPLTVHFDAHASDADGDALRYSWDFGDGAVSADASPAHVYLSPGTFTAWLTVSDGHLSVSRSVLVAVSSRLTLSTRIASVLWVKPGVSGIATLWTDFAGPLPRPDDVVMVTFDGTPLLAKPFSAFKWDSRVARYVLASNGLVAWLNPKESRLFVLTPKIALAKLDASNGVEVELFLGNNVAVENVPMRAIGPLLVYRRANVSGDP